MWPLKSSRYRRRNSNTILHALKWEAPHKLAPLPELGSSTPAYDNPIFAKFPFHLKVKTVEKCWCETIQVLQMTKRDFGVYERDEKRFSLWGANILEPRSLSIVQKFAVLSQISTLVAWPFLNLPLSRAPTRWRYKRPWDWGWQPFAIYPRCLREDKEASKTREELRRRFSRCLLAPAPGKKKNLWHPG